MHQDFLPPGIVVLTGAGISKESGIDTFRDEGGLWTRVDLEEVPKEVVDELQFFFVSRMEQVLEAALEHMPEPSKEEEPAKEGEKKDEGKSLTSN